jgi:hypothetical protein
MRALAFIFVPIGNVFALLPPVGTVTASRSSWGDSFPSSFFFQK